jgi:DNA-binding transcriptional MerR regulator
LTVEELAAATGMTVRNLREHQTRGLLPPPVLEGRKGYYDERHLARVRLIRQLQAEGLNLQSIAWLLDHAPADAVGEIARFRRALFAPWGDERPATYTTAQVLDWFGAVPDPVLARVRSLGLLRQTDAGDWEAPSPRLLHAGRELVQLGVSLEAALDVVEALAHHADAIAERFVGLFIDEVWGPFDRAGRPVDQWRCVREALERLRPIATEALLAAFQRQMGAAVDRRSAAVAAWAESEALV